MHNNWLREARERKGWTQAQAAGRLGVSQTYLSLLETGRRMVTKRLAKSLLQYFVVPPTALPVEMENKTVDGQALANSLGALGYPGFAYVHRKRRVNPAQLLSVALRQRNLEPRLTDALPWVACQYPDLNWPWLVNEAKTHDLQNRLGFVVAVAREVATRKDQPEVAARLGSVEQQLEQSRLVREDTLCRDSMTEAERRWLRGHRPGLAQHWNLLTGLVADHLSYAA